VVLFFSSATLFKGSALPARRAFKTAGETEKYFMVFLLLLTSALDPERPRPLPLRLMLGYFLYFLFPYNVPSSGREYGTLPRTPAYFRLKSQRDGPAAVQGFLSAEKCMALDNGGEKFS
jgi:hypothetical protein